MINWHEIRAMFYWNTGIALEKQSLYDFCCAVRAHQMTTNEFTKELRENFNDALDGVVMDEPTSPQDWTSGRPMALDDFKNTSMNMLDMLDSMDAALQAPPPVE